ncbi:helix-turn-helix domain-containing protein [Serinicoccus marinus]|uniref:helix-turn-helix domain-containing protein n=1 Tax=Serinicoccus marinus TaxID=247333 RepID=UPI001EE7EA56|nr:LysR family transcriptional regulator [Serinicoccus marinus]
MPPTDLSLRDLRSFLAVVDEGTFTDAAIALRTTQASVSRHVGALEQALGVRLLQRGGRVS